MNSMSHTESEIAEFWQWFRQEAAHLTEEEIDDAWLDALEERLQRIDDRIFFEMSVNTEEKVLILTAQGNAEAFPVIESVVAAAPAMNGWTISALKPPMGFGFSISNEGITLMVDELWFQPLVNASTAELGLRIATPDPDLVLDHQSVDMLWTIVETGLGERRAAEAIHHIEAVEMPSDPAAEGYQPLAKLSDYIESAEA